MDEIGVTVDDLREYLASDAPDEVLQRLIDEAEEDAHGVVGDDVPIELCRQNKDFCQAVRILADFDWSTRGVQDATAHAYPRPFLYRMNQCKWKLRRMARNNGTQQVQG